jgi:hypothetical protein
VESREPLAEARGLSLDSCTPAQSANPGFLANRHAVCLLGARVRFGKASRKLVLGVVLLMGAAFGAQMLPEEIEELLSKSRKANVVQVMKKEDEDKKSD